MLSATVFALILAIGFFVIGNGLIFVTKRREQELLWLKANLAIGNPEACARLARIQEVDPGYELSVIPTKWLPSAMLTNVVVIGFYCLAVWVSGLP